MWGQADFDGDVLEWLTDGAISTGAWILIVGLLIAVVLVGTTRSRNR